MIKYFFDGIDLTQEDEEDLDESEFVAYSHHVTVSCANIFLAGELFRKVAAEAQSSKALFVTNTGKNGKSTLSIS